jgi:predicted nucleic acid-binding protein
VSTPEADAPACLLVDASVAVKWLLPTATEPDADAARDLIGRVRLATTTLAHYEVASVVGRIHPGRAAAAIESVALVRAVCGEPVDLTPDDVASAARLAEEHGLTFYDASYAAIARRTGWPLVSADRDLLDPALAVTVADALAASPTAP